MRTRTLGMVGGLLLAAALLFGTFGTALAQVGGPYGSGWGPGGMMGGYGGFGMMGGYYGGNGSYGTQPQGPNGSQGYYGPGRGMGRGMMGGF